MHGHACAHMCTSTHARPARASYASRAAYLPYACPASLHTLTFPSTARLCSCNPAPSDLGDYVLSEARRREIIEYGFPDDGYDYLKHTRELAPRRATDIVGGRKPSGRVGRLHGWPCNRAVHVAWMACMACKQHTWQALCALPAASSGWHARHA
eukprot:359715-Chlamydomonas_euryale.AAC.7